MKEQVFCTLCGQRFTRARSTTTLCEFCRQGAYRRKAWKKNKPERAEPREPRCETGREQNLRLKYGMTSADFHLMLLGQGNRCAICRKTSPGGRGDWHVDHDHACCPGVNSCGGCIRGLLCARCNVGLGYFEDSTERMEVAIQYLKVASRSRR